jgi:predicted phosphodiesterase
MSGLARGARAVGRLWPFAVVILATLAGAVGASAIYRSDRQLSVGTVRLSVDPGHRGALDIYVPLVDWGARFPGVRLPARLKIEARTVDSRAVARVASGRFDVVRLRREARDQVAAYLRRMVAICLGAALLVGALIALALRGAAGVRIRPLLAVATVTALVAAGSLALLMPPRGSFENPEYYANGSQIPVALRVAEQATDSAQALEQDLDDQLVGLAQLLSIPRERPGAPSLPRLTLASDLHNNVIALPALRRAAAGRPLFFAGDLTTSGLPVEEQLTRSVVDAGDPFVFVTGNHDSDTLSRALAREGAIVLTQRGRLLPNGDYGPEVVDVAGLRVAGYSDPFERRRAEGYGNRREPEPTQGQRDTFREWLVPLIGRVDVVMVHSPALAESAIESLEESPPDTPLVLLTGHTHEQEVRDLDRVTVLDGGTIGGGGAGNFNENQPFGLAVLTYERRPFRPLAVDLVRINPRDGAANAERRLLGQNSP